MQSNEANFMIQKQEERSEAENKETAFELRGRLVEQRKIDRYKKDHQAELADGIDMDMDQVINPAGSSSSVC
jgi:hypothetical protein